MIIIGNRDILTSFPQLLIPKGEKALIDLNVHGWELKVTIEFDDTTSEQGVGIQPNVGGVRLIFQKWDNSLGVALMKPGKLADLQSGDTLEFMASNYRIGEINNFTIQFMINRGKK